MSIEIFIAFLIMYSIGYATGYMNAKGKDMKETIHAGNQILVHGVRKIVPDPTVKPGIIRRPSAQDLLNRNEPIAIKQEKAAIKESLDNIPELVAHKKLVEEYNKEHRGGV